MIADPLPGILILDHNDIDDLSPLAKLKKLRYLNLADNLLVDLEPLAGLPSLVSINLDGNRLSTLDQLQGLTGLTVSAKANPLLSRDCPIPLGTCLVDEDPTLPFLPYVYRDGGTNRSF